MKKLIHILKGWLKVWGILSTSMAEKKLSELRLKQCAGCEQAKMSDVLELINGDLEYVNTIFCNACTCPCLQKSLVTEEKCPLGKW